MILRILGILTASRNSSNMAFCSCRVYFADTTETKTKRRTRNLTMAAAQKRQSGTERGAPKGLF